MSDRPITPTRIIPAGTPLPERGPEPGEIPPWRTAPAPPVPPAPPMMPPAAPPAAPPPPPVQQIFIPQGPFEVHVTLQPPEPEPTRWQRLWAWATSIGRPWQICGALFLASLPAFGGHSIATLWASCVAEARAEGGQGAGYALALTPLAIAVIRIVRGGGTLPRLLLLAISFTGLAGAIHIYDPVTWITGVHPS
ncbi:hypothetical protein [Streptomyces sp. Wh19]|uniref:hypothetical protein n=1 Tax=Streptomyces sp. Wh19 TaxID=3076629 RepID=UPI0029587C00|nr:hypothetical protein [Streptomyces sp. Wh19]MDV9194331.1 hypothetical protein [Streptomyces sp. Wh19]